MPFSFLDGSVTKSVDAQQHGGAFRASSHDETSPCAPA
jgi:hypothetical protein